MSDYPAFPLSDYEAHRTLLEAAIQRVLDSGWYILGGEVEQFEAAFANWCHCEAAVGVANGTDAIELALRAEGIGEGDRVITVSHTATATAAAIRRTGARPVYVDIDPDTYTLCPEQLASTLSKSDKPVRAIVVVHLYGQMADLEPIAKLAEQYDCVLIEDSAQAHGARQNGHGPGQVGRYATFSFYPTKNLGAIGDGGAVITRDTKAAETLHCLRQYGWKERFVSAAPGINSRLDPLQAAILAAKLPGLDAQIAKRRQLAAYYLEQLAGLDGLVLPTIRDHNEHAWHLFVLRVPERDAVLAKLKAAGVPAGIHYAVPAHLQPGVVHPDEPPGPLPETERAVGEILSLPLHPYLEEAQLAHCCQALREALA